MRRACAILGLCLGAIAGPLQVPESATSANNCTRIPRVTPTSKVPQDVKKWASSQPVIGRGAVWTIRSALPPHRRPAQDIATGSYGVKFPWYLRPARGDVPRITGRRVDGPGTFSASANAAYIYPGTNFVTSSLVFSTAGCWEVTGANAGTKLTFRIRVGP
jgi:hypothetical protein